MLIKRAIRRSFELGVGLLAIATLTLAGCLGGGGGGVGATAPAQPTGIVAAVGDGQVTVSWAAASGVTSYNIYYAAASGVTTTNGSKAASVISPHVITNLVNDTPYHFVVTALNAAGESTVSSEVTATPVAVPVKPSGIVASVGDGQVTVSWTASTGATSYNVYYSTTAGVTTTSGTKVTSASNPAVITGLTNNTPYYFIVTAVNAAGESSVSSEVTATPVAVPAKPSGIVASGGDGQVTVSWTASTGATSYNVYYATASGVTTTSGTKVTSASNPAVITGLINNTPYYFVVTAVNAAGESSVSSEKTATPAATPQAPGSPTGVTVTSTAAGQATVSWTASPGATSYNVYYLIGTTSTTTATVLGTGASTNSGSSPAVINGLTSGATYCFNVTAVNAGGQSGAQTKPKTVAVQ